jgi:hypothetical protein
MELRKRERYGKRAHARPSQSTHHTLCQGGDHVRVGDYRRCGEMIGQAHRHMAPEAAFVEQPVDPALEITHMRDEEVRVLDEQRKRQRLPDSWVPR